jgi:hypothetical protein
MSAPLFFSDQTHRLAGSRQDEPSFDHPGYHRHDRGHCEPQRGEAIRRAGTGLAGMDCFGVIRLATTTTVWVFL